MQIEPTAQQPAQRVDNDFSRLFVGEMLLAVETLNVDAAIKEMERCLKLGLKGVWLNTMPSVGSTIRPEDDKFWAAAEELGMPTERIDSTHLGHVTEPDLLLDSIFGTH